jgi:Mg-chelatase subunit ChlD
MNRRHPHMERVSPEVGVLDEAALAGALSEDVEAGVSLLLDLSRATDPKLRDRARRLAISLVVPAARTGGRALGGGATRMGPVRHGGIDLDLDATLERLAERTHLQAEDLRWRGWRRPGRSVVLVVDASGSVSGPALCTAVVTAGALAARLGPADELAVVAFWSRAVILRHMRDPSPPASVIDRLMALRGGDTTDLVGGLRAALVQLGSATNGRRDVIVLTDGMANEGGDPVPVAATAGMAGAHLHVLGLSAEPDSRAAGEALAGAGGGRMAVVTGAAQAPAAIDALLRH